MLNNVFMRTQHAAFQRFDFKLYQHCMHLLSLHVFNLYVYMHRMESEVSNVSCNYEWQTCPC